MNKVASLYKFADLYYLLSLGKKNRKKTRSKGRSLLEAQVYGPYNRLDGRQIVILVSKDGTRRTVSYPKYLLEQHLGRRLDPNLETVDHWDSDYTNNDLNNLRIIPRDQHSADDTRRVKPVKLNCAWCDEEFERSPRIVRDKAKKKKAGPFCSRKCAGKYSRMLQLKLVDRFNSQKPIQSEYYKRKYVTASSLWEEPIDLLELIKFAEEDEYLYHETNLNYLDYIKSDGLLPTSYGQSFVNEYGQVDSPETALHNIQDELSMLLDYEDLFDSEFNKNVDEVFTTTYSSEDTIPRTYVHTKEPVVFSYGNILLRFPKENLDLKKDIDYYILDKVAPEKIEIKKNNNWEKLVNF